MAIVVRQGTELDWDFIKEGLVEGARLTVRPENRSELSIEKLKLEADQSVEKYHVKAERPETTFVAEADGQKAGCVWVTTEISLHDGSSCGWVLIVYVRPEFRRQGIGALLLKKAEDWTREQKAGALWLNAGAENKAALALYESVGFSVETVHMSKTL